MHLRGLDLNLLVILNTLLEEKNITRTSRRVYLSQSATSGALARLRDYFENELLVQVGHKMVLTPLAECLIEPVREFLLKAQAIIDQRPQFDPATSTRRFRMMMSDYVAAVLMPHVLPRIEQLAPLIGIEVLQFEETPPEEVLDRVEVDILILPEQFFTVGHPSQELFRDTYACIVWTGNREIGDSLTQDSYFSLSHVAMRFTSQPDDSLEDWILRQTGRTRRVEVTTHAYGLIPHFIVNTSRIATIHRKLAEMYAGHLPIRIMEPPFEMPQFAEKVQWHSFRDPDPGIAWMRDRLREAAVEMSSSSVKDGCEPLATPAQKA